MIIFWEYLLPGLFFAWLPGSLLRGKSFKYFKCEQLSRRLADTGRRQRRWWKAPSVWIEPLRGYVAATYIVQAFAPAPHAAGFAALLPLLVKIFILSIGVTIQCRGDRLKAHLIAPAGFMAGLLLGWLLPTVSIPAVILGAASAVAFRRWEAGFIVGSVATLAVGHFFMGNQPRLIWAAGIYLWPVILAWFLRRNLVLPVRN